MASEHILAVGKIERGIILTKHAYVDYLCSIGNPLGEDEPTVPLQQLIDEAADTEDYEWDIDDREYWSRGGW
jgi:hypothetical protein